VAHQPVACVKSILKQPPQQGFILRKGDHTIANVAWRKNTVFTPKPARATAIIRDRDNSSQIADWLSYISGIVSAPRNEFL
jgi:hypothetical protein